MTKYKYFTIAVDTICGGYAPILCNDKPIRFATEAEAQKELLADQEFYQDCFVITNDLINHKTIYKGN